MSPKILLTALAMTTILSGCNGPSQPANDQSMNGTVHLCSSCHGITGRSISPEFPILAGQQADYLEAQLQAFRDHSRADPHAHTYMWGMAAHLDDATISAVAHYYASQSPEPGRPAAPEATRLASTIFTSGIDSRGVPACAGCHGEHGEGQGAIPRLAGQHSAYLAEQLTHFRSNARANETMHQNSLNLTDAEIAALADYLRSL